MKPPEVTTDYVSAMANGRNQVIYWEDGHMIREAESLPEIMRQPYIWLKTFAREDCKKDMDVLVEKFREHGVTVDRTNWSRILKGRWRLDTRNKECTPCISLQNFLDAVKALREDLRIELLQGGIPFVETDIFHTIRRYAEKKTEKGRVNRCGLIVGPTGLQKTASYKELCVRHHPYWKWMEANETGSESAFKTRLAFKMGASHNVSGYVAEARLFSHVSSDHCFFIDNTQHLVRDKAQLEKRGILAYRQPTFEFMRRLQDETGCAFIWSVTPDDEEKMFSSKDDIAQIYNEQFEGRLGGLDSALRLPNYSPQSDVVLIAESLGFKDARKNGERLLAISHTRGRIRRFFEILQDAKDQADADQEKPTLRHIEDVVTRQEEEAAKRVDRTAKFKPAK